MAGLMILSLIAMSILDWMGEGLVMLNIEHIGTIKFVWAGFHALWPRKWDQDNDTMDEILLFYSFLYRILK